jgi:hypothetical protein
MKITVGPVVGKVTTTTARVLAEFDRSGSVTCVLTPTGATRAGHARPSRSPGRPRSDTVAVRANRPFVFTFDGLAEDTTYTVVFKGVTQAVRSSLRTFPEHGPRRIAIVSCNKILVTKQLGLHGHGDLWHVMDEKYIQGEGVDLLLHMGDQVYADSDLSKGLEKGKCTYVQAHNLVKSGKLKGARLDSALREMYRQDYRESYTHPPTAAVLANVPNLMVNDDHELRDDYGDRPEDREEGSDEHRIATAALEVYYAYQRQLHDDIDFDNLDDSIATGEHHMHLLGDVGVMFLETRFCKGFNLKRGDKKVPYLGSTQWRDIDGSLTSRGEFANARILLVVAPTPIVFFNTAVNTKMATFADDLEGHWSAPLYRAEQARILHAVNNWRQVDRANRDVVLLGGDVHMGGYTTVAFPDKTKMEQVTASAISNALLNPIVYSTTRAGHKSLSSIADGIRFTHGTWTRQRNFGILDITDTAEGGLEVRSVLVTPRTADIFRLVFCCGMAASYNKPKLVGATMSGGGGRRSRSRAAGDADTTTSSTFTGASSSASSSASLASSSSSGSSTDSSS